MSEITRKQTALIHIANNSCGLSDEEHRAHCIEFGEGLDEWTASSKYLTYEQASRLLDHLKNAHGFAIVGARSPRPKRPSGKNITSMPTPEQQKYLDALAAQVSWRVPDGFARLCTKIIKKKRPATSREASRMIECLKGMLGIKRSAAAGEGDPF